MRRKIAHQLGLVTAPTDHVRARELAIADLVQCKTKEIAVLLLNRTGTPGDTTFAFESMEDFCAAGDLNGDGRGDLVFNSGGDALGVLLTNADGSRPKLATLYRGDYDHALSMADVDGDGRADVIDLMAYSRELKVRLSQPDGTLAAPIASSVADSPEGRAPSHTVFSDLNGDGKLDLVVAMGNAEKNALTFMFGDGTGSFVQTSIDLGLFGDGAASDVAVADFDGDGVVDLAVPYGGRIYTMKNTRSQ